MKPRIRLESSQIGRVRFWRIRDTQGNIGVGTSAEAAWNDYHCSRFANGYLPIGNIAKVPRPQLGAD